MKIRFPKSYSKYIDAMFEVGILRQEEDLALMFKYGMQEVVQDLVQPSVEFPPDMPMSMLQGKQIELEIPYELSEDENENIEAIRKHFKIKREIILRAFFLQGLIDKWPFLKDTKRYKKDSRFRKLVDEMPHDLFFEEEFEDEEYEDYS